MLSTLLVLCLASAGAEDALSLVQKRALLLEAADLRNSSDHAKSEERAKACGINANHIPERQAKKLPVFTAEEAHEIGKEVLGLKHLWTSRPANTESTMRVLFTKYRSNIETFLNSQLGSSADADTIYKLVAQWQDHSLGPWVNFDGAGTETYRLERERSWSAIKSKLQLKLFDPVLATLRTHFAPQPVRFHSSLNVTGWPIRVHEYDKLDSHPLMRNISYFGAPPHRDMVWRDLHYEKTCSCLPDLYGPRSHHTVSYTLPLIIPKAGAGLRVWQQPETDMTVEMWLAAFMTGKTSWEYVPYQEGVLAMHSGQEYHSIAEDTVHATRHDELRMTLQGHGVFCDGEWILF